MQEKILMGAGDTLRVWSEENRRAVGLTDAIVSKEEILAEPQKYKDTAYIFSTWGMPVFTEEEIKNALPSLKAVFYAAGSVQAFARPFLNAGVQIFSARAANAVPVAEYTVAQIILANKGFFSACRQLHTNGDHALAHAISLSHPGNYGATVGIIGCGMIGGMVVRRLQEYKLRVIVFDAFLSEEKIKSLGAEKVSLEELFRQADVVSNHLANLPATVGMLTGEHFASMKPYAVFLNTGRGASVKEKEMTDVLAKRSDLTAVLDVTDPEPPQADSPLHTLLNVFLTPHISGSQMAECARMGAYMADAFLAFEKGEESPHRITLEMLNTMA